MDSISTSFTYGDGNSREIGNLVPNNQRQRRTCYALCHVLYPVSAALASFFRMDLQTLNALTLNPEPSTLKPEAHNRAQADQDASVPEKVDPRRIRGGPPLGLLCPNRQV